jgi:hypothetical protein
MRRFAIYILLLILAVSAKAQFDTATVLGTVTDPSGAVVAHCHAALRNTATAVEQTAVTDDRGEFRFVDISIGSDELKVTAKGFQPATAKFELTVGARQRVDVGLKVATASSTVTATAEAAQLETDSSEHSQVVAAREIAARPLNGREYSQLVELSTGVVPTSSTIRISAIRIRTCRIRGAGDFHELWHLRRDQLNPARAHTASSSEDYVLEPTRVSVPLRSVVKGGFFLREKPLN